MSEDYMDIWEKEAVKPKNNAKGFLSETAKTFARGLKKLHKISTAKNGKASGAWKRYQELSNKFGMDAGADRIMHPRSIEQRPGMFDDDLIMGKRRR